MGVAAEIAAFLVMGRWLHRYGPFRLIQVTLILASLRWVIIALFADVFPMLFLAQLLHAASFGMGHVVAIHWVHRLFRGPHQVRGQALYSSMSFGAGSALGILGSGYLWESYGSVSTYLLAAAVAAAALLIARVGLRRHPH